MANEEHVTLFKQGVINWNKWRDNHPDIIPDLSETVLGEYDFDNVNLIAVAVTEGHNFVAFEVFVPIESEIIAAFFRYCRCAIAMDNSDVEVPFEGQYRHRTCKHGIEASMSLITPKGSIDPSVVNFLFPLLVLCDGQFFPLTADVQEFQNVVEDRVQREFWLRTATPPVQVGQDKFLKLF